MSDKSLIEWTDATWNPIRGCSRVSEGCRNCYAERVAARFSGPGLAYEGLATMRNGEPRWTGEVRLIEEHLWDPIRWRRPRRIFVNSMSDLFHERLDVETIARVFDVMCDARAAHHTFQVLTKRPERMGSIIAEGLPGHVGESWPGDSAISAAMEAGAWPPRNIWLGISAENQVTADERIPPLLETPAAVRFVSAEPLLGPIDLRGVDVGDAIYRPLDGYIDVEGRGRAPNPRIDWIIAGGESGPGARPVNADWVRAIRDACIDSQVAFFLKQWGEWSPWKGRVGKRAAGRELDGRTWDEFPEPTPQEVR